MTDENLTADQGVTSNRGRSILTHLGELANSDSPTVEVWTDDLQKLIEVAQAARTYRLAHFANARRFAGMTLREARVQLFATVGRMEGDAS